MPVWFGRTCGGGVVGGGCGGEDCEMPGNESVVRAVSGRGGISLEAPKPDKEGPESTFEGTNGSAVRQNVDVDQVDADVSRLGLDGDRGADAPGTSTGEAPNPEATDPQMSAGIAPEVPQKSSLASFVSRATSGSPAGG